MNKIAITIILLGSMLVLSGCIEVGYKTEVVCKLGNQSRQIARPRIVDNGYLYSPKVVQSNLSSQEPIQNYTSQEPIICNSPKPTVYERVKQGRKAIFERAKKTIKSKKRGFTKFKNQEI